MTKCPKQYKNVGMESFGNKKKVTVEMLTQFCKNDAYLYSKVKELFDLTDPENRKRHVPPFKDDSKSSNITYNNSEKYYTIDTSKEDDLDIYFKNDEESGYNVEDYIDLEKSTLEVDTKNAKVHIPLSDYDTTLKWEEVKQTTVKKKSKKTVYGKAVKDSYYEGPYGKYAPNGTWYAGYDYTKTYSLKADWKKNPYNPSYRIPSLTRVETFKALHTGKVTSVTLNVKADKKTAYPLRVEIRETDSKGYPTSKILGYTTKKFNHTNLALEAFQFKNTVPVTKGKYYAIVIRCPLAPYSASYHIAGWQQGCYTKNTKSALATARKNVGVGYSFESTDNCKTFKKYNAGDGAGYKNSNKNPVAFGYEVKIAPSTTTVVTEKETETTKTPIEKVETIQARAIGVEYHLYLKPIRYEQITKLISKIDTINNYYSDYCELTHHISPDGKNWYTTQHSNTGVVFNFTAPYKDYIFYRITMKLLKRDESWTPQKDRTVSDDCKGYYNSSKKMFYHSFNSSTLKYSEPFLSSELIIGEYYQDLTTSKIYEYFGSNSDKPFVETILKPYVCPQTVEDTLKDNPLLSEELFLNIHHEKPSNAYLRTTEYVPMSEEMLPPCIWAEFDSDYDEETNTSVDIDIIRDLEHSEPFKIVKPTLHDLRGYELVYSENKAKYAQKTYLTDYLEEYKQQCSSSETLPTTDEGVNDFIRSHKGGDNDILEWLFDTHKIVVVGLHYKVGDVTHQDPNSTINLNEYMAYPMINCDLENDSVYLIEDNGDLNNVNRTSDDEDNYILYSEEFRIHNFKQQIDKVEIVDVRNNLEPVYEFIGGISADELRDYLNVTIVSGYYNSDKFYYKKSGSTYSDEITGYDGKMYYDLNTGDYYECSVNDSTTEYTKEIDHSATISSVPSEWRINSENNYRLEILYENLSDEAKYFFTTSSNSTRQLKLNDKFAIKVSFRDTNMIEGVDYKADYDNGFIRFYNKKEDGTAQEGSTVFNWSYDTFQSGNLKVIYNPLWVRGLTDEDLPIRMDLWTDTYQIVKTSNSSEVHKIKFDDYGNITTYENGIYPIETIGSTDYYVFKLSVNAVDNLRAFLIEREDGDDEYTELIEDKDFTVDYRNNKVSVPVSLFNMGEIIDIKYTPNLTEYGLCVGYRLTRDTSTEDNPKVRSYYFTTRT